jgi:hypothetical protein
VTADQVTFVLCIEDNAIRSQALLLCESIRAFGGPHRSAPILCIAPRPGLGVDAETRRRLDTLGAQYVEEPLNRVCPEYGSANRVFAAARAEQCARTEWIVVLDSDTILLDELELLTDADVAIRPVDTKGSTTEGAGDPQETYWAALAELQHVSLDCLPFVQTTDGRYRVRASYNCGLVVVRRELGILRAWADLFTRSVDAGLKPWHGRGYNVFASTGFVGETASEYWGSNQAAAALVIWSRTKRVIHYPRTYNLPLHLMAGRPDLVEAEPAPPIHVHYHWLFGEAHYESALTTLRHLNVRQEHLDWLSARLPLR